MPDRPDSPAGGTATPAAAGGKRRGSGRWTLTLRLLCGLSTAEVAAAFLTTEPTMAARITRAKKKILAARIPYAVPAAEELPERVGAVLDVVHLLYTAGQRRPRRCRAAAA